MIEELDYDLCMYCRDPIKTPSSKTCDSCFILEHNIHRNVKLAAKILAAVKAGKDSGE